MNNVVNKEKYVLDYQFIIGNLDRNIIAIKLWLDSCPESLQNIEVHFLVRWLVGVLALALALYNVI